MEDKGTVWLPEQASTLAPEIDALFYFVYWVSIVIFVGVVGAMVYFAWKYRRRDAEERARLVKENKVIEVSWIVIPTLLVLIVFTWGFRQFVHINVAPPNAYEIRVNAAKWLWQFEYPNGTMSTGELHVPEGRPVRLVMSSSDVIHSLFIPAFRVKHDVLPNRYTSVWFEATKQDTFQLFCTEYCGTQHSGMLAKVIVHSQDEFNEWVETGGMDFGDLPPAEAGRQLYQSLGCQACHSLDGTRLTGPTFQGLFGSQRPLEGGGTVEADENYLREAILQPSAQVVQGFPPVMPPNYSTLSEDQIAALIAFIKEQQ